VTVQEPTVGRPSHAVSPDGPEGREVLHLYLSDTRRLFNSMDPSPFRERDLDPGAATYIVDWAEEAPRALPLGIAVHVGGDVPLDAAAVVPDSVRDYFQRRAVATRRRLQRLFRLGRRTLAIAFVFLASVIVLAEYLTGLVADGRYAAVIENTLVIGAWVALWRPLEIFLYDWWPIRAEARLYDRLGAADVRVIRDGVELFGPASRDAGTAP
jgi:hypothetical protein